MSHLMLSFFAVVLLLLLACWPLSCRQLTTSSDADRLPLSDTVRCPTCLDLKGDSSARIRSYLDPLLIGCRRPPASSDTQPAIDALCDLCRTCHRVAATTMAHLTPAEICRFTDQMRLRPRPNCRRLFDLYPTLEGAVGRVALCPESEQVRRSPELDAVLQRFGVRRRLPRDDPLTHDDLIEAFVASRSQHLLLQSAPVMALMAAGYRVGLVPLLFRGLTPAADDADLFALYQKVGPIRGRRLNRNFVDDLRRLMMDGSGTTLAQFWERPLVRDHYRTLATQTFQNPLKLSASDFRQLMEVEFPFVDELLTPATVDEIAKRAVRERDLPLLDFLTSDEFLSLGLDPTTAWKFGRAQRQLRQRIARRPPWPALPFRSSLSPVAEDDDASQAADLHPTPISHKHR